MYSSTSESSTIAHIYLTSFFLIGKWNTIRCLEDPSPINNSSFKILFRIFNRIEMHYRLKMLKPKTFIQLRKYVIVLYNNNTITNIENPNPKYRINSQIVMLG